MRTDVAMCNRGGFRALVWPTVGLIPIHTSAPNEAPRHGYEVPGGSVPVAKEETEPLTSFRWRADDDTSIISCS